MAVSTRTLAGRSIYPAALVACLALYVATFTLLVHLRYENLHPRNPDLALFNQTLWLSLHGRFMDSTILGYNYLGEHMSPILILLIPLYSLHPGPDTLALIQTGAIASAAIPLYLLARDELGRGWIPLVFAAAYLLYPATGWVDLTGFYTDTLGIPILMALFLFLRRQSYPALFATAVLALAVKEDWALIIAALGLYLAVYARKPKIGFTLTAVAVLTFLIYIFFVVPAVTGEPYRFVSERFNINDPDFQSKAVAELSNTALQRVSYLLYLLFPVLFLPLFNLSLKPWTSKLYPNVALVALPGLVENLISSSAFHYSIESKFPSILLPFVFVSSVYGFKALSAKLGAQKAWRFGPTKASSLLAVAFFTSVLVASVTIGPLPGSGRFDGTLYAPDARTQAAYELMDLIPANASVGVQCCPNPLMQGVIVKLSNRMDIHFFPRDRGLFDYLLIDGQSLSPTEAKWVEDALTSGRYVVMAEAQGLVLLHLNQRTFTAAPGGAAAA